MYKFRGIILIYFVLLSFSLFSEENKEKRISIKETQVRNKPSFLGKVLYKLKYGDYVEIVSERSGWVLIMSSNNFDEGWLHSSAITTDNLTLNTGAENLDSGASESEVALAGKGFNKEVEESYISQNNMDYSWIDIMEELTISDDELIMFVTEGELKIGGTKL